MTGTEGGGRSHSATSRPRSTTVGARRKPKRRPADPFRAWRRRLDRYRPALVDDTLDAMRTMYGRPTWQRVHDPTSELVLTILSQNSADINAERAFDALRARWPSRAADAPPARVNRPGWGGLGIGQAPPPDWAAVASASPDELIEVIRPGGLAAQKAPTIHAALARIEHERGDFSLEFLADMTPLDALEWLMSIPGIGRKTASVVLLFSFGMPLMPVDRHVERVSKRIGLIPPKATALQAHDYWLALIEPGHAHEAHVNLISHGRQTCHALRPACGRCAIAPRCRYVDRRAP
jgi:endonuclease III